MSYRQGEAPLVAVVGATGAAGTTVLRILEERDFPVRELRALASARSAYHVVSFRGREHGVLEATPETLAGAEIVFFAAGSDTSRRLAPVVAAGGGIAIDKSSAYRMDPAVPLVVPEVNPDSLATHRGIIANPNCVAIPLTVALAPLHRAYGLRRIVVSTYQSASGAGRELVRELEAQTHADSHAETPRHTVYPHVLHGNVVPGGWSMEGDDNEEELKVIAETRRVLGLPDLAVSISTVRVPVKVGHAASVFIEFERPAEVAEARELLARAPGVRLIDDPVHQRYPTPRDAEGCDEVLVGRVRADRGHPGGLDLFLAADNLRKGAATNAVQVAELALQLIRSRP